MFYFLDKGGLGKHCPPRVQFAALWAALAHDVVRSVVCFFLLGLLSSSWAFCGGGMRFVAADVSGFVLT